MENVKPQNAHFEVP